MTKKNTLDYRRNLLGLLCFGLVFCTSLISKAATKTFTGLGDGVSWHQANNWSGNTLPTSSDSVVIITNSVELSTTVTISAIYLKNGLNLLSTGNLTVNGSVTLKAGLSVLLSVTGELIVNGAPVFTEVTTQLLIKTGGFLQINNSYVDGCFSEGELKVNIGGRLEINNSANNGIYSRGEVTNNGQIVIDGAVIGIKTHMLFSTFLTNNKTLIIKNCTSFGLQNLGAVINNYDRLLINNTSDFSIYNQVAGTLAQINNFAGATIIANNGIHNNIQTIVNDGYMECIGINNAALVSGIFINNDSLILSSYDHIGIEVNKVFTNNSDGVILTDIIDMTSDNITFIFGRGELINHGLIDLDLQNQAPGIYLGPELTANPSENSGQIMVRNAIGTAIIFNNITFNNYSTGQIDILGANGNGMTIQSSGILINEGEIVVEDLTIGTGFVVSSFSNLENSGTMSVKNLLGSTGFYFYLSTFLNNVGGLITIFHGGSNYAVDTDIPFTNEGTVSIYMLGNAFMALKNTKKIINKGDFNIFEQNTQASYSSIEDTFFNDTCGVFKTEIPVVLSAGDSLVNHGLLTFNKSGKIQSNGGKVLNYCVVESLKKYIDYNWFNINEGVIINQWYHSLLNGYTYGAPVWCHPNFTLLDGNWYGNTLFTIPIGVFDAATGKFVCSQNTTGDKLSFPVDFYGKCTRTIEVLLLPNTPPECINIRYPIFDASLSANWLVSQNWNDNIIPDVCSKATIPAGQNATLTSDGYGEAQSINIEIGAVFEAQPTSVLIVD